MCASVRGEPGRRQNASVPENYRDEQIARTYRETWADPFEPDVVHPAGGFLAELAVPGPIVTAAIERRTAAGRVGGTAGCAGSVAPPRRAMKPWGT